MFVATLHIFNMKDAEDRGSFDVIAVSNDPDKLKVFCDEDIKSLLPHFTTSWRTSG